MSWKAEYVILIMISTIIDYIAGLQIHNSTAQWRRKLFLCLSIATNLGLLFAFKYFNFFSDSLRVILQQASIQLNPITLKVLLPVGISFYTFQTLSYTIDVYRGKIKPEKHLGIFAVYVSYFPQLVAGPIERAKNLLPQFFEKHFFEYKRVTDGLKLMLWGFFKKLVIADKLALIVNFVYNDPTKFTGFPLIIATVFFAFQIYCDFSGYSDIAIGAATILGFHIPANFNKPYFATSPVDFWRRWHISLSTWLRDYLYIPLGGNRKSNSRTYVNLLTVMIIGGLWHGASWNFLIWGALHGGYLAIHKIIVKKFPIFEDNKLLKSKKIKIISILTTQYFIFLAWLAFRVEDINALPYVLYKYVVWDFATDATIQIMSHNKLPLLLIVGFFILNYISYKRDLTKTLSELKIRYWILILFGIMTLILLFYDPFPEEFIYFRF